MFWVVVGFQVVLPDIQSDLEIAAGVSTPVVLVRFGHAPPPPPQFRGRG